MRKFCLLLILIISIFESTQAQQSHLKFKKLTTQQGLSLNTITCILKDSRGFMWFGTADGLNRYDGYTFKIYKYNPKDPSSLRYNHITAICEDYKGRLWVGTNGGGISRLDRNTDAFVHYQEDYNDTGSISNSAITAIYEDRNHDLWIGTYWGLNLYNEETNKFTRFYTYDEEYSLSSNVIADVVEDNFGNLWVATKDKGLNLFDRKTHTCKRYLNNPDVPKSISSNVISTLLSDSKGRLWIGTLDSGLNLFQPEGEGFLHFKNVPNDYTSISGNNIFSLEDDGQGNLWVGTETNGLNYYNFNENTFFTHWYLPDDPAAINSASIISLLRDKQGLLWIGTSSGGVNIYDSNLPALLHYKTNANSNIVNTFAEDKEGNIWIGTDGGGLDMLNRTSNQVMHYTHQAGNKNSLNNNVIVTLLTDRKGNMWIGTYGGGANYYDRQNDKFYHYTQGEKDTDLNNNNIYALLEDDEGRVWMGTLGGGVNVLEKATGKIVKYLFKYGNPNTISNNYVSCIIKDRKGDIWVGTFGGGISLFNKKEESFTTFRNDYANLGNNVVTCLSVDSQNNLWVGTHGNGLCLFDKEAKRFIPYTTVDGLPNDVVNGIHEDDQGNLWISTNNGISKFNRKNKTFRNYDIWDGLQDSQFRRGASLKTKNGEILFGGNNGFNMFAPDKIKDNSYIPPVIISDFQIFNKPVVPGEEKSPLQKNITESEEIILNYDQSVFTLEFTALNYTLPEKNQYAYKLEGFDQNWNYVKTQRRATYTNLDPGEYIFKVKASNHDGIWNKKGTSLKIIITPPFWRTWWFILLAIMAIVSSAYIWYTIRINNISKQNQVLEKQVRERTAELESQGEKLKLLYSETKDSIRAAQVIQQSILPSEKFIKQYLPESFILNKPKDVVSGDFYWFNVVEDQVIIAAVDCTGHGVSGAFMSITGHYLLNQSIYGHEPLIASEILDRLHEGVIRELHQQDKESEVKDGMDIALCIIDKNKKRLQYAGANNPLYILRGEEIIQVKANRFPIGMTLSDKIMKFTNHEVELQSGDSLYIFSDGYADQLGGNSGDEKFMYPRFRELLISISSETMDKQKILLDQQLYEWKDDNEQLDDVLVIGFKV